MDTRTIRNTFFEFFERREHGILWMTLNRPEVLNAADRRLHTELVEVWKTIDRDPYLPVIVLTAQPGHKLRALNAGAKDFISKPLDALETMLRIWNLLETRALYKSLRELVPAENIELLRQPRTLAQQ